MADVDINKFRASVVRDGSKPSSPGFVVSEGQDPVDPSGSGQNHLPVTIAAAATGLSITESQVLGGAGTTSQYLRGDGSLDTFPDLTGYVPYTGAHQTVNLNTQQLQAGHTTLTTNGSTETLTINHTSGSGKAINVTKGGAGEGLYVNKTSGSGNAATIVGTLEATTLVKTGGTSSQFLKADGSVDSTSYQPLLTNPVTGTGTTNYLPKFTGASTIGNSNIQDSGSLVSVGVTSTFASNINVTNNVLINLGTASTASTGGTLWLTTNNNTSRAAAIQAITQTTDNAHDLLFYTNSTFDTPKERLRIFSDGNVFIGPTASNNGARLQVSGTATFSNTVTANDNIIMLGGEFYYVNKSSNQFARNFVTGTSGSATLNYSFWNGSSWQTVSTLNSTGAATFSSSVTATQFITGGTPSNTAGFTNSFYAESAFPSLTLSNTGGNTGKYTFGVTGGALGIWNNATSAYEIFIDPISSGQIQINRAATFSSDVNSGTGFQGRYTRIFEASGQRGGFYPYNIISGGGADYSIGLFSESELFFLSGGGVTKRLVIANNGAVIISTLGTGLVYSDGGSLTSSNPSDKRLKNNIQNIKWGLDEILKLRPVSYNWKNDQINQGNQFGFIAQEVQEVMSEAVKEFGEEKEYLGLEKDAIYATLVKAIQELKQEIDNLKN